jgi:hypothetical protein
VVFGDALYWLDLSISARLDSVAFSGKALGGDDVIPKLAPLVKARGLGMTSS